MNIDFGSISFKIQKLPTPPQHPTSTHNSTLGFNDPNFTHEQQTVNPFRRTFHLFKHVQIEKKTSRDKSCRLDKLAELTNATQTTYSLENFDSFKNFDSKPDQNYSKQFSNRAPQSNQCEYIKIQSNFHHSNDFSLIVDDLNSEIKCDDLAWDNHRRIKTQLIQSQVKCKVKQKGSSGIFCLTAQDQSGESTVKQFYLNLKDEQEKLKTNKLPKKEVLKTEIKELMYDFIDKLQNMEQDQIDPQFLERVQNCLITITKIPVLPSPAFKSPEKCRSQKNIHPYCQSNRKYANVSSSRNKQMPRASQNKQNWMQTKNLTQKQDIKSKKDNRKKKWI